MSGFSSTVLSGALVNGVLAVVGLAGTVAIYIACKSVYKRWKIVFLSPILTSFLLVVLLLHESKVTYSTYMIGAHWLTFMLKPATVAFAVPLYKYFNTLKQNAVEILSSVALGSSIAIITSVGFALWFHLDPLTTNSLAPRSVTTPVAMAISQTIGGVPVLTAVFVILTAIIGIIAGPVLIRSLGLRTAVAKGTLLGMGAHGIGTARAFEFGSLEGTIASLSMILAAGITVFLSPWLVSTLVR